MSTEERDPMDVAHEAAEQKICDDLILADEKALSDRATAAGFTDLHGGIEDGGVGLRGMIHGRVEFVKEYFKKLKP